ncbi:MAG: DUF2520 domain-containing protein [Deltaproteobacteria bacterium]|nr:DUF2520 domain-containing protein [Deltaproteobacteria bacterium]
MQALPGGDIKATVAIVGCGIVGTAMGKLLGKADYYISGVATQHLETARRAAEATGAGKFSISPWEITRGAKIVFVTTPDDLIESTCMTISEHEGFEKNAVVIHCSGALSSDVLSSARDAEAMVATLHPLQSFASTDQAVSLVPGSFCTIEGDKDALPIVREIVEDIGGILLEITAEKKTLYHAAAVAASNYLVTLLHLALELDKAAGLTSNTSYEALLPLIKGTLSNIGEKGIPGALTGPIARGDVATVSSHLDAMAKDAPKLLTLYRCLGLYTIDLARAKGTLSKEAADKLRALLNISEESN